MFLSFLSEPTKEQKEISSFIKSSAESNKNVQVVGRGTIVIEPRSIFEDQHFKDGLERAARIVDK